MDTIDDYDYIFASETEKQRAIVAAETLKIKQQNCYHKHTRPYYTIGVFERHRVCVECGLVKKYYGTY